MNSLLRDADTLIPCSFPKSCFNMSSFMSYFILTGVTVLAYWLKAGSQLFFLISISFQLSLFPGSALGIRTCDNNFSYELRFTQLQFFSLYHTLTATFKTRTSRLLIECHLLQGHHCWIKIKPPNPRRIHFSIWKTCTLGSFDTFQKR